MEDLNNCPLCGQQLQLKQISFTQAIFICLNNKCPYPVYGECIVVNRKIEDIKKTVDLCAIECATYKQERSEVKINGSESAENFAEQSLLLDLEKELLKAESNNHCLHKPMNESVSQSATAKDFEQEIGIQRTENNNNLLDLDDFLIDLLR